MFLEIRPFQGAVHREEQGITDLDILDFAVGLCADECFGRRAFEGCGCGSGGRDSKREQVDGVSDSG